MIAVRWLLLLLHIAYAAAFLWIIVRIGGWLLELIANGNSQHPALPLLVVMEIAAAASALGITWAFRVWIRSSQRKAILTADGLGLVLSLTVLSPMIFADYSPLVAVILGVICIVATVVLTRFSRVERPSHQRPRL
jgi:hypothetical protein